MQSPLAVTLKSVSFLLLACQLGSASAVQWTLEKQQQEITLSSKTEASGYKTIRVSTVVSSRPEALLHLLDDVQSAPLWIANCIAVKVLSSPSENERIVHSYFSAPWPVKNRDMVTYSKHDYQQDSLAIVINNRGDTYPMSKDYVRMQDMNGRWQVDQLAEGKIKITYQGGGNPAGNLPHWLANKALIDATFETFVNLSTHIVKDKYQLSN